MINDKNINELLAYDPDSGLFTWKHRPLSLFKSESSYKTWNSRYANKKAGRPHNGGYWSIGIHGKQLLAHRVAWYLHYGIIPSCFIDHINGVKNDNRISNLREASRSENLYNAKTPKHNTSGVKGVFLDKISGKWKALITLNKKQISIGLFTSVELASMALQAKRRELHGAFANNG